MIIALDIKFPRGISLTATPNLKINIHIIVKYLPIVALEKLLAGNS